jgi:TP901 family phage tail tape measure protein
MSANANIRAGRAYVEVTAETSKLKENLSAAQTQLRDFGKACQGLGRDMMALGGALSLPFVLAEKSFAGFDDKMRLVQAVTSSTGEAFDSLTKTAQRLGRETSFTAQQVADAMIALGRMGFNPSEIEASISSVLNLSRATGTELAESADIAANSLRIFGLEAGKMTQVADILTATANGSAQTLTDLFEGLKMAAPQAASCGESIDETCAALGVMANMGIKGSLAGTALRKAFIQFADTKVQGMLREVGVESVDASGNLRKMAAVMRDIAVATSKMPTAERLSFMKDVFDVRGMMSGISLAGNIDEMDAFLAKLKDVNGQADETARAMDRGIGGSFRLFQSAVEGTMNAVGEALNSTLQPMVGKVTAVINSFTKWVEANKGLVTSIAATVASVTAFGAALFALGTASRVLGAGVGVISGAVSGVTGLFSLLAKRGIVAANAFSTMAQAFSDYRNASVPALVGTSKLLAALNLPIDSRAKQIASSLVLMSNAETAAVAKSAIAAKFASFEAALKRINVATVTATVSAKLHGIALAKTVVAAKFDGMIASLKGLNASTVAATVSAKLHGLALAKTAVAARFDGMIASLRGLNLSTVAATVAAKAHTAAVAKTSVAARFGGMLSALKGVNAATAAATASANLHTVAVAKTSVAAKFGAMLTALKGVNAATVAATVSAKMHTMAVAKTAVAAKFTGMITALRGVNAATIAAALSAKLHTAAVAKTALAAKFGSMIAALKGVNAATVTATASANLHTAAVAKTSVAAKFGSMLAQLKGVNLATIAAAASAKLHALSLAKAAAAGKFAGLVSSLKGVNLATIAATVSAKLHGIALAKTAVAAKFDGMIAALKGVNAATIAAAVSARLHTAAVAKTALAARFDGMVASLRNVNLATIAAAVSAKLHALAVAKTAVAAKFEGMVASLRGVNLATVAATVSANLHTAAVAKTAVAARFQGLIASIRNLNLQTIAATVSAKLHAVAVAKSAFAGKFEGMIAGLKGVNTATTAATVSANLHTTAVARTATAAKFGGIVTALTGLNRATIAATVSAKAHAAAETIGTLATKAATAAHAAFAAVSGMVTASHAKAALGAAAAGTANVALALTTKVVAAGYLAATAAAAAFCAIPITWVLIAVVGALVGLCAYMASATKHTAQLSDEMGKLREKGDDLRATDQLRMERLQQLADKENLNNAEMKEAERLSNQLKSRYGALGISIDKATNSISLATDAQERFNAAMKAQALQQVEAEMAELQKNIRELDKENESLCGFWVNAWNTITFRMDKAAEDIAANGKKIGETMDKLADARRRRDAILGNEEGALTGGKTEKEQLESSVGKVREEKGASREDAERSAKKLAEIEKKLTREQQTELENEISDIRELRDEYKQLIQTVLSFEKSKKQKDLQKIADLEGRLAEADAVAEKRIAAANARAKKKFDKEISSLQGDFDQTAEDIARNRTEGETDRKVEATLKSDAAAGMKLLNDLINRSKVAAAQAKAEFDKALKDAAADGTVTDEEKEKIDKAKDAYAYSEGLVDKYAAKLRSAQEETQKRTGSVKPQGAFYARAASMLRGNQMEQRMFTVTQEIEKHTKKTAELLKDGAGGSMSFT